MSRAYELIHASGSHRDLGRQHGEQCRDRLLAFLDYLARLLRLSHKQIQARALRFLPLFERHCPHLVEEIQGLAAGARVPFADALAVQIRGELGPLSQEGCTTFVIAGRGTADGRTLIGQTSDMDPELEELGYLLRLEPSDKPAVLMWTFGGQIGYHGMNALGVAHFANALGGGPAWRFALPHYPVKRLMLEQKRMANVFRLLRRVPVCSNGNYVLCDGKGEIADVELTPQGFEPVLDQGPGFIVHTNHFVCGPEASPANHAASVADSFPRLKRMQQLVEARFGQITVADLQTFLADHAGHPTSICRHSHDGPDHPSVSARGKTVAALVAEPGAGVLHVARGNPCQSEFATYHLN